MFDIFEAAAFLTPEFFEFCRLYLITFAFGLLISCVFYLAWASTGIAPLDYHVWLVQLAQSPGRRIIKVFTVGNYMRNRRGRTETLPLDTIDLNSHTSNSANASADNNSASVINNDNNADQTTVVIVQTPYSPTRLSENNRAGNHLEEFQQQIDPTSLPQNFGLEADSTANVETHVASGSPNSADIAVTPQIAADGTTAEDTLARGLDDINFIYRLLRANLDHDIARAATIALYSRNQLSGNATSNVATTANNVDTSLPNSSSDSGNNRNDMSMTSSNANNENLTTGTNESTANNTYNLFQSDLAATILQDVDLMPDFADTSFSDFSGSSAHTSLTSLTASLLEIPLLSSTTAANVSANQMQPSNRSPRNYDLGFENLTSTTFDESAKNLTFDESAPSTSGIFSADSTELADSMRADTTMNGIEKAGQKIVDKSWENALTTVKLKFLDDTQRLVKTWLDTSVGDFKRRYFSEPIDNGKVVRLIYQGQLLRDDSRSLASYGIRDQCALHCHIGNRPYQHSQQHPLSQNHLDQHGQRSNESIDAFGRTSTQGVSSLHRENGVRPAAFGTIIGSRLLAVCTSWMELLLLTMWSGLSLVWDWAQDVDENNNDLHPNQQQPDNNNNGYERRPGLVILLWRSCVDGFRGVLRFVLSCMFDASHFSRARRREWWQRVGGGNNETREDEPNLLVPPEDEDDHQFNIGNIFDFLVTMKISTIWIIVIYFPQVTDLKGFFFLGFLTILTMSFLLCRQQFHTYRISEQLQHERQQQRRPIY